MPKLAPVVPGGGKSTTNVTSSAIQAVGGQTQNYAIPAPVSMTPVTPAAPSTPSIVAPSEGSQNTYRVQPFPYPSVPPVSPPAPTIPIAPPVATPLLPPAPSPKPAPKLPPPPPPKPYVPPAPGSMVWDPHFGRWIKV